MKKHQKENQELNLTGGHPVFSGSLAAGIDWQLVKFNATGRYFCFEELNAQRPNDSFTTVSELYLTDENGKDIPGNKWKVLYADSEELDGDDGKAENVFDLQNTTVGHMQWQSASPKHPHHLVIDMVGVYKIGSLKYLPRQDSPNGRVKDFNLYFGQTLFKVL